MPLCRELNGDRESNEYKQLRKEYFPRRHGVIKAVVAVQCDTSSDDGGNSSHADPWPRCRGNAHAATKEEYTACAMLNEFSQVCRFMFTVVHW